MKTNLMDVHVHPEAANEPNPTLYKRPPPAYSFHMPGGLGAPGRIDMWSADQMTGAYLAGARVGERLRVLLDQRPSLASGIEAWSKWHIRVSETEASAAAAPERVEGCRCETCVPQGNPFDGTAANYRMILCATCGNKRCPHATDHRNACTNSNEPGQKGSSWEHVAPWPTSGSVTMVETDDRLCQDEPGYGAQGLSKALAAKPDARRVVRDAHLPAAAAAAARVRAFLDEYSKRRGLHPDTVYSLGTHDIEGLPLNVTDLRALVEAAALAQPAPVQQEAVDSEGVFTTPHPLLNNLLQETYWLGKGPNNMDTGLSWHAALQEFLAALTPPAVAAPAVPKDVRAAAFRTRTALGVSSHPHDRAAFDLDDVQALAEFVHLLAESGLAAPTQAGGAP